MKDVNHFSDTLYYTVRAAIRENGGFFFVLMLITTVFNFANG